MTGFDMVGRTRLVVGEGALAQLPERLAELSARRVLLVTDPGLVAAGHAGRAQALLEGLGLEALTVFSGVGENPTTADVDACRDVLLELSAGASPSAGPGGASGLVVVAVGGGSAIDCAKAANVLACAGGRWEDWHGLGEVTAPLWPMVAVPTTAGTGSEMQSAALISDAETHRKIVAKSPGLAVRVAILDPALTLTMPRAVTAATGLDALGHGLEAAVTTKRNPLSAMLAREAVRLLVGSLEQTLDAPDDLSARADVLLGASWAGSAIEHSMLGGAHAMANPLTAELGLTHGFAVASALPAVVAHNMADAAIRPIYDDLAHACRLDGAPALLAEVERLVTLGGAFDALAATEPARVDVGTLVAQAVPQWTGHHNPRPLDAATFEQLYGETLARVGA